MKYTREDITKLENERDQYKLQRDELSNKLDKECNDNYKLEGQLHDMTKQRDSLIKDLSNYRRVLKVFARLIKGKLAINASGRYIQYQHMLDDIGINIDESEVD